jgi:PAS domain S-box-containing protein
VPAGKSGKDPTGNGRKSTPAGGIPLRDRTVIQAHGPQTRQLLRQVAEDLFAIRPAIPLDDNGCTPEKIVHELQIQQIELEMQNEALRDARLALEVSRDRYADLFDFAPVGYLTLSKKGIIEEGNLTCATILGVERRNLIKSRIGTFVAPDSSDSWYGYFKRVLRIPDKLVCELKLRRGDGSQIHARLESIRIQRNGEPFIRMAVSDISDRVRAEENLALKSHDLDELTAAYRTIATGQENLRLSVEKLSQREHQLTDALAEKEILLSEIHQRVKNNLTAFISLLSLEGSTEETVEGRELKKDLRNRARSMALIHETLYQTRQFSRVDMVQYLTPLTDLIVHSYSQPQTIRTVVEAKGISLDLTRATPIGLIINELVTNSLKHGFPQEATVCGAGRDSCTIGIQLTKEGDSYLLNVYDNGVGMPTGFDPLAAKSMGLRLVNFLAKHQLRADVEVSTRNGTEFMFRFKE